MKRISVLMFATAMAIVLWSASGWAQEAEFKATVDQKLDARPAPAKVTTEDESVLPGKGYVEIGTISASQPGKKANAEVTNLLETAILKKAAEAGGDVVRFRKEGVAETTEVPTGKTKTERSCLNSQTINVVAGQNCVKSCFTDSLGHTNCINASCSPTYQTIEQCVKWGEPTVIPITKKEESLVSAGTVWRYDPKLAAVVMRLRERGSFIEVLKTGDLTEIRDVLNYEPGLAASRDEQGATPLLAAASKGYKEAAELLLAKGADVNAKDEDGVTPLYKAALMGHKDMAELLLAHGANVNLKDENGVTPLYKAAEEGHKDVAELLLDKGADVNAMSKNGGTPLYEAAESGSKEVVELLLARGADVNAKNGSGETPLHAAAENGHKDVAELLRQHGGHE